MDSGLSVILGALIALTGSSLIPWWRESISARRARDERRRQERDDALVDFLAKNIYFGMIVTKQDHDATSAAFEARSRAAVRLLLFSDDVEDRAAFSDLLNRALPIRSDQLDAEGTGIAMASLQDVLIRWSAGEFATSELPARYRAALRRNLARNQD